MDPAAYEALEKDFQEVSAHNRYINPDVYHRYCKNWLESKVSRSSELNTKSCTEHSRLPMSLKRDSSKGMLNSSSSSFFAPRWKVTVF